MALQRSLKSHAWWGTLLKQYPWLSVNSRITVFDISVFLRQFATLFSAGIPVIQCCDLLAKSQEKPALQRLLHAIQRDIAGGSPLHVCFRRYPSYFNTLTCQMIELGEQTGKLDVILVNLAVSQEKRTALTRKLKQALFYPVIITVLSLSITACLFVFVIPRFAELYQDIPDIPLLTRCIFWLSTTLLAYAWMIPLVILALIIFCKQFLRKLSQFFKADHIPFIKTLMHKIRLITFVRHLALAFSAGMPITAALAASTALYQDTQFIDNVMILRSKLNAGLTLNRAMATLSYFPSLMTQMIKIGEESGQFEQMLCKLADFFEAEINQTIAQLSELLEPLIMVMLGALIGGLIIALYLPIFNLGTTL